jgi:hypothetical protein
MVREKGLMEREGLGMIALARGIEVWLWWEAGRGILLRIMLGKKQGNSLLSRNKISGQSKLKH